ELNGNLKENIAPADADCLVVNTTGELKSFYEHATLVFVGKSLTARGGQNPIEPGALGKAMVFGPNMQNFADVTRTFIERHGAVQAADVAALETAIDELLSNPARREQLGRNAHAVVQENLGAIDRTLDMILEGINGSGVYVASKK
ncbi:MAG: glycosyltransferase, partial [Verrucomicrobiales bacterium]